MSVIACAASLATALTSVVAAETSSWVTRSESPKASGKSTGSPSGAAAKAPGKSTPAGSSGKAEQRIAPGAPVASGPPRSVEVLPQSATVKSQPEAASSSHAKSLAPAVPATGDDAAYIAYDQGRYLTALELAQKAAEKGEPQAHTLIGRILEEGSGVPRDEVSAFRWYSKAAELGDPEGAFSAGLMLAQGRGVGRDMHKAAPLFEQAAMKGHPTAHYNLALMFIRGEGKPENQRRAALHLRYAAERGISAAQYDLAMMLSSIESESPNMVEATDWLEKAARAGHAEAEVEYAITLFKTGKAFDERRGAELFARAADKGVPVAQNRLARCYAFGRGITEDPIQAAKWHLLAKSAGLEDQQLEQAANKLTIAQRLAAEKSASEWLDQQPMR